MRGINWLGIVVALVLTQALGFAWYGPLFQDPWMDAMRASGIDVSMQNASNMTYVYGSVNSLIFIVGLDWVLRRLGAANLLHALAIAVAVWFFFNLTTMAIGWLYMSQTLPLLVINSAYQLLAYIVAAASIVLVRLPLRKTASPAG